MPDSVLTDIADDLVTYFGTLSLSQTFTSKRVFLPDFAREQLTGYEVTVYPASESRGIMTRASVEHIYTLNVVIRAPVNPASDPDITAALYFVEQLTTNIKGQAASGASWLSSENDPVFDLTQLQERHEFLSVLTIQYKKVI